MKRILVIVAFLCLCAVSFGQEKQSLWKDNRNVWEADFRLGKYIPFEERHAYMKSLPQYGVDLRVSRQTDGRNQWEKSFNHLNYGAFFRFEKNHVDSIKYNDRNEMGYERESWIALGDCYSLGGFINGSFYRGKAWSFDYDLMGGLSFWTHWGDEFIGSCANVHLALDAGPTFMIEDNFDLLVRYQFSHSSNAAIALPNCGINVLSWMVGLRYHPNGRPELQPREPYQWSKKTSIYASEAFGILQTNEAMRVHETADGNLVNDLPQERPYYLGNVIQLGMHRQFHPKFSYDVALDFGYTGETKRMFEKAQQDYNDHHSYFFPDASTGEEPIPLIDYSFVRSLHIAPSVMFEVNYNRFAFCIGGAYYVWHGIYSGTDQKKTWGFPEDSESNFEDEYLPPCYRTFYERLGFKYYLGENRNMFVGTFMKVHEVVIDYAEFTVGVNLFSWESKHERTYRR